MHHPPPQRQHSDPLSHCLHHHCADSRNASFVGETFGGYRATREISRGGQGAVLEGMSRGGGNRVAIKISLHTDADSCRRLRDEARVLQQLSHRGITRCLDRGTITRQQRTHEYLILEYIHGCDIRTYARAHELLPGETITLFCRVCEAVAYAHARGIIHRDLKPANVLVGPGGRARVLDFGIAHAARHPDDDTHPDRHLLLGTLAYMSPEQAWGNPDAVGPQADVYALGVMLYELLAGRPPIDIIGYTPAVAVERLVLTPAPPLPPVALRPTDAVQLRHILTRCLLKSPRGRFATAGELLDALQQGMTPTATPARRHPPVPTRRNLPRRRRGHVHLSWWTALLVVIAALLACVARAFPEQCGDILLTLLQLLRLA
ncbi:MAG: serine/threonine protein kinase [Phycisphaerales bacterium]|nr:serine/threonine protein kinase [Phycisphaerales bacterium]